MRSSNDSSIFPSFLNRACVLSLTVIVFIFQTYVEFVTPGGTAFIPYRIPWSKYPGFGTFSGAAVGVVGVAVAT